MSGVPELLRNILASTRTLLSSANRRRLDARHERQARQRSAVYRANSKGQAATDHQREFVQAWRARHSPGPHHEAALPAAEPLDGADPRLVCFYLPQFHAVPGNDAWWGRGFTEWRNLARAMPRFSGHEQPRVPADLGFYDLTHPDTLRRQVELARGAGIDAFSFYYYNFDGRRILEKPIEAFLADRSLDLGFCLTWANENWTRRWDGLNDDVLLRQSYLPESEAPFADDACRHFADPRYIRLGTRPLFILYRSGLVPDCAGWVTRFRDHCARHGENPYMLMVQGFGDDDPRAFGLDGAIEFPPHKLLKSLAPVMELEPYDPDFSGRYYRYDDLVAASLSEAPPDFDLVKCVAPGWDNEPRRPGRGTGFIGATPTRYEDWLRAAIGHARAHPIADGHRCVFVNAWNEWAEGAYLEPDVHNGHAYLNATRRARGPAR